MEKVSIIGLGYIGLPTAIVASQNNIKVFGLEIDDKKIDLINNGISPIEEPSIKDYLSKIIKEKKFFASKTIQESDCFVIAVPTPFDKNKNPDLSFVFNAAKNIVTKLKKNNLIILESTVPVGTTEKLANFLEEHSGLKAKKEFFVAYCPERVLPGKIFHEIVNNDRVIGGICDKSCELAQKFYKKFVKGKLHVTSDKIAEMVKLVENSSRDIQIALANQISSMCDEININPFDVIKFANMHPRVNILQPGCGVGGHCISVDPWFLIRSFPQNTELLQTARKINNNKPNIVINKVIKKASDFISKNKRKPKVLALGLSFKPDIDDIRESPALKIAQKLNKKTDLLDLSVSDPFVKKEDIKNYNLNHKQDFPSRDLENYDILLFLVKHSEYKSILNTSILNTSIIFKNIFNKKIIIDPCGIFSHSVDPAD